ncbi:Methyl-accepting chemotaxis protein [Pseudomonas amygdali pv. eriobotryae]|uniref:Methyl-accepting chemotaxis protein n=1 Tax=Pseudomonas amygdali pv. eriobotryae TaxID=129137 RepID=A0A0P9RSN0_PSEA0|nr:hypothetical protein [Pseudomonas amygdali]KPX31952.1 Methyl-accepting chemotaxis protein [Pseudomonas amygdali pv. eriobotryae]KWS72720.1 hypothetical protein AL052_15140 [Pseudomonas amygdali pv. eriobotryae]RML99661.1 Methyl-accepting chemotaxis protein [Pseudomonas amygdali pv. eriobotryae]RMO61610.1 Methyl-accepting chemotaxis protein [Pseudomonas amygdali pv. eriobotryae]GFZ60772.1 hypothetical protein PSE10A_32830 [Pseudomonas amygdali pv. eriobotryae]
MAVGGRSWRSVSGALSGFRALLAVVMLAPMLAQAADAPEPRLYRYVDSRGVTVIDTQGVPPDYVAKGYEVLNSRGRVVQVVPPARTAEQIRQSEADKRQAAADAQLLSLYSSVDEVDRVKARKLAELDALIGVAQGNIQGLAAQQRNLQGQAANLERAGRPVQQGLVDQLNDLRDQQQKLQTDIAGYQAARVKAEADFAEDRLRVQRLTQ